MRKLLMGAAALAARGPPQHALADDAMATPGKAVSMVMLPKFLGILPFDQAHKGAEEAAKELKNPTRCSSLARRRKTASRDRSRSSPSHRLRA